MTHITTYETDFTSGPNSKPIYYGKARCRLWM
jgi:hypothetical protein